MQFTARIFRIPADAKPGSPPQPAGERLIEAPSHDAGKARLAEQLEAEALRVRAISFAPGGFVAYVEEAA
jgi:hypothetical protein